MGVVNFVWVGDNRDLKIDLNHIFPNLPPVKLPTYLKKINIDTFYLMLIEINLKGLVYLAKFERAKHTIITDKI